MTLLLSVNISTYLLCFFKATHIIRFIFGKKSNLNNKEVDIDGVWLAVNHVDLYETHFIFRRDLDYLRTSLFSRDGLHQNQTPSPWSTAAVDERFDGMNVSHKNFDIHIIVHHPGIRGRIDFFPVEIKWVKKFGGKKKTPVHDEKWWSRWLGDFRFW